MHIAMVGQREKRSDFKSGHGHQLKQNRHNANQSTPSGRQDRHTDVKMKDIFQSCAKSLAQESGSSLRS